METAAATKRTRVSRGQSRKGCYSCSSRKIKCDEIKPTCNRCQIARLDCEYAPQIQAPIVVANDRDNIGHSQKANVTSARRTLLPYTANEGLTEVSHKDLAQIGFDLLLNSYSDEQVIGQNILRRLALQYFKSSVTVNIACAALGAADELQQPLHHQSINHNLLFETRYAQAVDLLREEIAKTETDRLLILTACTFLTAVELILRRRQNAMKHFRGAFHLFIPANRGIDNLRSVRETSRADCDVDIEFLLRTGDVNVLLFTLYTRASAMSLTPVHIPRQAINEISSTEIDRTTINIVHACCDFFTKAAHCAVEGNLTHQHYLERDQHQATVGQWTSTLTSLLETSTNQPRRSHLLVIRNLCICKTMELDNLFSEHELLWDKHDTSFRLVISSAERVLEERRAWRASRVPPSRIGFTSLVSVAHPLYLSALKCRDPHWRQRAIDCLAQVHREGPWIGEMLAAITSRVRDIELSSCNTFDNEPEIASNIQVAHRLVPERVRVSIVRIVEDNGSINGALWPSANSGITQIRILRRKYPVQCLPMWLIASAHFGKKETKTEHLQTKRIDAKFWEEWQESIQFGPGSNHSVLSSSYPKVGQDSIGLPDHLEFPGKH